MKLIGTIFCALLIALNVSAQNIVPNSSFEDYDDCPAGAGNFTISTWYKVGGSPDYYNQCGTFGVGVPISWGGGGYANSGDAYVGIAIWAKTIQNGREFFSIKLTQPLIPGKKYNVGFYVSLMDSMWYASKNIGAYFCIDSVERHFSNDFFFAVTPQIKYTGTEYLTDKEGWMKIENSFYADGGEQFMTIGNFDDDNNTDTLLVSPVTSGGMIKTDAYYYIDDVSVELDTTVGINELDNVKFEVYPNPAKESVVIDTEFREQTIVRLFDITGREVLTTALTADKTTLDVSGFAAGVYTAVLLEGDDAVGRRKIIIE